jgi:hypothetical protein
MRGILRVTVTEFIWGESDGKTRTRIPVTRHRFLNTTPDFRRCTSVRSDCVSSFARETASCIIYDNRLFIKLYMYIFSLRN